ncbi:type II toxin-antitoxin system RelE/ParE family toxin [Pannonibacter phragmitetus]|uniref:type II toxin-antitoxin system RelE/ParE family toxin n=1 Tax=Pannonibacter phragmitetus TaxID=121719 RepID=UPI0013DE5FBA|nr:type II toxin-antitoxin system RelE/ParE family toxin [Pannonibacter phragmitetus]
MKLKFTPQALAEFEEILFQIDHEDPFAAARVKARIAAILSLLADYPRSGIITSSAGLRRIVARPYPYVIFYEIHSDAVVIIGLRHGARDPATMPRHR